MTRRVTDGVALIKHGLRTALIPMATFFAYEFALLFVGATFTEKLFGWHGMGEWFIDSVGISALVSGRQTAEVSGVKLVVTEPSRFVHRQLWVTGLLGLFGAPEPCTDCSDPSRPALASRP